MEVSPDGFLTGKIDNVSILFPSVACASCIKTARSVISHYAPKTDWLFLILTNGKEKNARIIYQNELATHKNVTRDSPNNRAGYTAEVPNAIWVALEDSAAQYKFVVRAHTLDYLKYLSGHGKK